MTISSTTRKVGPYTGTGVQVDYPFTFKAFTTADIYAVKLTIATGVETVLALTTDYTVTLNDDQNNNPGGILTMNSALSSAYKLTISTGIANLQPTDLTNQGGFFPTVINDALDRATIQIQQLSEEADRALHLPLSSEGTVSSELPIAEAGTILGWNADGDAVVNYTRAQIAATITPPPFISTIVSVSSTTTASALGYSSIEIISGGGFSIATGHRFTIDVPFRALAAQVFFGNGDVEITAKDVDVSPLWFPNSRYQLRLYGVDTQKL